MSRIAVFGLVAASAAMLHAQTINLRGKVTNATGQAVSGAVVELVHKGLKDTTGPDGSYAITGTTALRHLPQAQGISLDRGMLQLSVARSAPLKVEVFDLKGNQLRMEAVPNASEGVYRWDLNEHALSDQMMLIKASVGKETRTFRYSPMSDESSGEVATAGFTPAAAYLQKAAADVDTLRVTAAGYTAMKAPVATWDATINITLTPPSTGGVKSAGCGKTSTLKTGKALTFTPSGGSARTYNLMIPADYDNNTAYRLVVSIHWLGGTANNVTDGGNWATTKPYFGLQELANPAGGKGTTIFVAPQGNGNSWPDGQVPFITALVHQLESELCIDTTRVFAEGFSMGGSMSYALACGAPDMFRAVAVHSGGPMSGCIKTNRKPVAYFMTHGTKDGTCTYPAYGVPQINDFAQLNGCQAMDIAGTLKPTNASGLDPACADFKGCSDGHPARACIFVGDHNPTPGGANSWVPGETWKFFTQF